MSSESRETTAFPELGIGDVRPTEREALLLRYVGALSLGDVAAAAGIDETTARTRLSRGLASMGRLRGDSSDAPSPDVAAGRRMVEGALANLLDGTAGDAVTSFVAEDDACGIWCTTRSASSPDCAPTSRRVASTSGSSRAG